MLTSYTWSESEQGQVADLFGTGVPSVDPNNQVNSDGPTFWDRTHIFKSSVLYSLPYGINVSGNLRVQTGQPFSRQIVISDLNQGSITVNAEPRGSRRYPSITTIDLRVAKRFDLGGSRSFEIMLDGSVGAAGYNKEFGRAAVLGYFRTFEEQRPDEPFGRGYHKPIMLAGGVGSLRPEHVAKSTLPAGARLVVLGGRGFSDSDSGAPITGYANNDTWFDDVADGITDKMLRRHPHVFGEDRDRELSDEHLSERWQALKQQEKAARPKADILQDGDNNSAIYRARQLQKAAAEFGFDWPSINPVFDKLEEEIAELRHAYASGDDAAIAGEIGDVLFVCVNIARHARINAEIALRQTNRKFVRRFEYVQQQMQAAGIVMEQHELEQMERFWQEAKGVVG